MDKPYYVACSKCGVYVNRSKSSKYVCGYCKTNGQRYGRGFHGLSKTMRVGSSCEICGDKKKLNVHHKDKNKRNNLPDNLMILCSQCHNSIHGHALLMPKFVKWGKCGKRLIYHENKSLPKQIQKDKRWGNVFYKRSKGQPTYLLTS